MTKLKTSKLRTYAFSLFLLISSLFLTPNYFYASDSIAISLDKLLLFESGKDVPQKLNRKYINCFEPEARYINIELNVKNLKYTIADQDYKITFIWRYLNGAEFGKDEATFHIKSDWQTAYINRSWGWPEKGKWPLGRYTAQVFVNGTLFAEKDYFINFSGHEYISFPEINKPIENTPALNEGIICQTLHQYKVDPYFNSYYPIEFSNDGKDIAYCLSQFERTSGYKTTTVTRNVFLFKNNKQILPVYFRIDPFFDKKLENLAYLGVQTTGGTFNDIYAYYNGNQLLKSILMPAFYISPDCKKYTYVLNTMNRIKSSFTWDDAYEFVMINQQKVQAEYLTNAKSINIKEPVIYIKNEDNSYNAIYSAKYKVNKQVSHTLFNQAERISPEFDGYISKPYLSADNKKVAYIVQDKKEWFIMINDKRITKGYKEIKHDGVFKKISDEIVFCESGNNAIYQAKINGDWYVLKGDERISDGFSAIESIVASADGSKIAYKAKSGKKWSIYLNKSKISPEFDEIGEEITFSPDGSKLAYAAGNEKLMFVMVNDKKISPDFEIFHKYSDYIGRSPLGIVNLTFNKSGDKIAYLVNFSSSEGDLIARKEAFYLMINEKQILPKMYAASLFSINQGELFYAGIDSSDFILHHVKIDF